MRITLTFTSKPNEDNMKKKLQAKFTQGKKF